MTKPAIAPYLGELKRRLPGKTDLQLELMAAHSRPVREKIRSGTAADFHRRRAMEMLWPARVWHAWREQMHEGVQECLDSKTKELLLIGSSNSNKTAFMADTGLAFWWSKPEVMSVYITSPYEKATEGRLWSEIVEQFQAAKDVHKKLPGKLKTSDNSIVLSEKYPRSFIKVTTVDQIGKLVGTKSRDFNEGNLIILADELPAFSRMAGMNFLKTLPNLWSVPNILVIGAGNFANVDDALGIMCDPDEQDIPNGYDGFDPDRHFRWRTKRGGLALRFDGLQSPNVKVGEDRWPFVTTIAYISKLAAQPGGLQSADAMRFVRSAPVTALNEFTVLNSEAIRAGGAFDPFEWKGGERTRVGFTDPGFGGDPCVIQKLEFGWQALPDGGRRQVMALLEGPVTLPVQIGKLDEAGNPMTVMEQAVDLSREHCRLHGIPPNHFGYDGSMRAGIGAKFVERWSAQTIPLDCLGPATERRVSAGNPKLWKDEVDRHISELWFASAGIVNSYQLKRLNLSPKAVTQLCSRTWQWVGKKKKGICTKLEYKEAMKAQGKNPESPGEADALVGAIEIARRVGFQAAGGGGQGAMQTLLTIIREREARSAILTLQRTGGLKSGQLNSTTRERSAASSGKLHATSHS